MRFFSPLKEEDLIILKEGDKYVVLFEVSGLERSEYTDFESAYKAFQAQVYNEEMKYKYLVNRNMAALGITHERIVKNFSIPE